MVAGQPNRSTRLALPWATLAAAALLAFAFTGTSVPRAAQTVAPADDNNPTFYADVLPILKARCMECHSPAGADISGMVAPMSLTRYEEVRRYAPLIAQVLREGRMPPWDAAPEFRGKFRGERVIDDAEKATLIAWAEAGAPAGDPSEARVDISDMLRAPEQSAGGVNWSIGSPDLIIGFERPFRVGDEVDDLQLTIPVRIPAEDHPRARWIRRAQIIPGSPNVHHILAWPIAGIAHGVPPVDYPEGYGVLLPAGPQTITFQMHYNKTPGPGTGFEDVSRGGAVFWENGSVIRYVVQNEPLGIFDFEIPAGESNYSASRDYVFQEDSRIIGFLPHMHLRGKAAKFEITYPDGRHEVLLDVPVYRFDWQHQYNFKEPVLAPKGSKITMTLWWDNSAANVHNPDPGETVYWGTPTVAEMGYGFLTFTRAEPIHHVVGDPIPDNVPQYMVSPLAPNMQQLHPQARARLMQQQQQGGGPR
jgi:hypothetical protein